MLEHVAKRITSFFIAKDWISISDAELSCYMLQCKLLRICSIAVLLCVGAFLNSFIPTALFLFCFMSARKRSGGYHAKTPLRCLFASIAIVIIVCKAIAPILMPQDGLWCVILLAFSLATFCVIGTVNHPSMHLSQLEVKESKKRLLLIAITETVAIALIFILSKTLRQWMLYMALGLAFAAVSTIIAKAIGQEVKYTYGQEA